jgi:tRNA (guanosine-2'-O-)-methyltransferase
MRRRSAGVVSADQAIAKLVLRLNAYDPELVIALLEPLVTDARRDRLLGVVTARLGSVSVVFDAPHDPHNGAAVVRSCEAFGVHRVHVVEAREPFLVASSVAKSAEKWIDLQCHKAAPSAIAALLGERLELVAAVADGELLPHDLRNIPRVALVLGNERDGVSEELLAACSRRVRVPMRGFVESLNVSVTAAILLAAATAGRPGDLVPEEQRRLYARGLYLSVAHAEDVLQRGASGAREAQGS